MPNHVLQCDCGAGNAYLVKDLTGAPPTPNWAVQADLYIPSSTWTVLAAYEFSCSFIEAYPGAGAADGIYLTGDDTSGGSHNFSSGNRNYWTSRAPGNPVTGPGGAFPADTWVRDIKFISDGTNVTVKVGSTVLFSYAFAFDELAFINIGGLFSNGAAGEIYYLDNVKVGTAEGLSDVFSDDFEGTLSGWDTVFTGASIVDDPATGASDFSLSGPVSIALQPGESPTATISTTAIGSPEALTLILDTDGLLVGSGLTVSLDDYSPTSGDAVTLTVTAAADMPLGTYALEADGSDGTNTHEILIEVDVVVAGAETRYDTIPDDAVQVGSSFEQAAGAVAADLCVHQDSVYCAWVEDNDLGEALDGPYVAVWDGAAWTVVGSSFETPGGAHRNNPLLASDGTNLYLAYLIESSVDNPNTARPAGPPLTVTIPTYFVRVWQYDGSGWSDLGYFGLGSHWSIPPAFVFASPLAVSNVFQAAAGYHLLRLTASPDEVGSCYIAWYEDGYTHTPTVQGTAERHLWVAGFGGSSLVQDFTSLLWQPGETSNGIGGFNVDETPPYEYECELVGSGSNLLFVGIPFDVAQGAPSSDPTLWKVWQPGGFLTDISLSGSFTDPYSGTLISYAWPIVVSNVRAGIRYLGATRAADFTEEILQTSDIASPDTLADIDGWPALDRISVVVEDVIAEPDDLWATTDRSPATLVNVLHLTTRCSDTGESWQFEPGEFPGPGHSWYGRCVLHDNALWLPDVVDEIGVWQLPICRACGACAAGLFQAAHV